MIDGKKLAAAGFEKLGTPYAQMDCQAFVEWCLAACGLRINLAGSNAWFREVYGNGVILTPEECVRQLGTVPAGAFLFILEADGGEPEKYKADGLGNASHIGIATGRGEGAIHSSASRGCVAESRFRNRTINGGWNRVGLWNQVAYDYGESAGSLPQPAADEAAPAAEPVAPKQSLMATVWSENGKPVNLRKRPDKAAALVDRFRVGTEAELLEKGPLWSRIRIKGKTGWMMTEFLRTEESSGQAEGEPPATAGGGNFVGGEVTGNEQSPRWGAATIDGADISYCVTIFGLDRTQADALHIRYPDSVVERSVG